MLNDILGLSFFLALATYTWKAIRYVLDSRRNHQWFYLLGVPANLAFALALAIIIVGSGPDPILRNDMTVFLFRLLVFVWAVFGLLFELFYGRTFVIVKHDNEIYHDVDTHGD